VNDKERERFREEFVSIITDQLQNPLTTIEWISDWLSRHGEVTEKQEQGLAELFQHTQGLFDLIRDLFVVARIDKNAAPQRERFNLNEEMEKLVKEVKKRHPKVAVSFMGEKDDVFIVSSKALVVEAMKNIIWNAVEYSDPETGDVQITIKEKEKEYVLSCQDNGIGIPAQDQDKVFKTFYRGSNAKQMKQVGTGLGLFIVKLIADYLQWGLSFESRIGEGARFSLLIPREGQSETGKSDD